VDQNNSFRASFQTGFRIPDTQAQYIYFPSSSGTLLGSTEANAARYGVHNGGSWTQASYQAFQASGGSLNPSTGAPVGGNASLLQTANVDYVKPEQLQAYEVGYKGVIAKALLVDLNYYYTSYTGFIGNQIVASKNATQHQGKQVNAGTLFALYANSAETVKSQGVGVGLTYNLPKNFTLTGSYNWANYTANETSDFRAGFNTPTNKYSVGVGNRKVAKNLGFNVNLRYQDGFFWQSSYVHGTCRASAW